MQKCDFRPCATIHENDLNKRKLYKMAFKTTVRNDHHRNVNKQRMVFTVYTLNTLDISRTMMILNMMRQKAYVT